MCPPICTKTCGLASHHCNSVASLFHVRVLKLSTNTVIIIIYIYIYIMYFILLHILSDVSRIQYVVTDLLNEFVYVFYPVSHHCCARLFGTCRTLPRQILAHLDPFAVVGAAAATFGRNAGGGLLFCGEVLCRALRHWDWPKDALLGRGWDGAIGRSLEP